MMGETVHFLAKYGYWVLFLSVLARQACLPVPANLALLAAGALAGSGKLNLGAILVLSVLAFLLADLAWFEAGRRWGNRILHFACGISEDPSSCVQNANRSFARYGVTSLLISKFVLGLDAVAAPLAGASGTTRLKFLIFDALGALFWSGAYAALGYAFGKQLDLVAAYASKTVELLAVLLFAGMSFYMVYKIVHWLRFVHEFRLARITPEQLREKIKAGEDVLILDVRRSEKHSEEVMGIPGAIRMDPRDIEWDQGPVGEVEKSTNREIVIYCTCPSEYTSARVALTLRRRGLQRVRPLAGGLRAWRDHGFEVTTQVTLARSPDSRVIPHR
jgi:membrane protein DedA with SNARE-associated domain/rhodanese-related sulfurtransferase